MSAVLGTLFVDLPALVALFEGGSQHELFANAAYRETFLAGKNPVGNTLARMLPEAASQGFVQIMDEVFASGRPERLAPDTAPVVRRRQIPGAGHG